MHATLDRRTAVRQEVYGETGEEAGEVEDLIIGPDGALQAVIVEVGGFLDIGDTQIPGALGRRAADAGSGGNQRPGQHGEH